MGDKTVKAAGERELPVAEGDGPTAVSVGDLFVGTNSSGGDLLVRDGDNAVRIWLDGGGDSGPAVMGNTVRVRVDSRGTIDLGGASSQGRLEIRQSDGRPTIQLTGENAAGWFGGRGADGDLFVHRQGVDAPTMANAAAWLRGEDGSLRLRNGADMTTIELKGSGGSGWFGGRGDDGDLLVHREGVQMPTADNAAGWLQGKDGSLTLRSAAGKTTIELKGERASGWFGGRGVDGDLLLFDAGQASPDSTNATVWIQGSTGDIVLRNADCAEEFDVRAEHGVGPGSVLVLGDDGQLTLCREAYDTRVAGVVSGAAGVRPGIVLGRVPGAEDRLPVGLAGKVVCNVDASFGPVRVGSLLTTSPRPGYAMVASDRERAFGAVIGKAMAPLDDGLGAIPILVGLQ